MTILNKFEQERHQLLNKLVSETQAINNIKHQESAINQIAVIILRSRPLCRQFNSTPLTGVYREIYDLVKAKLLLHLHQYLFKYKICPDQPKVLDSPEVQPTYLYMLQTQFFQQVLDDVQLKKLGLAAQKYAVNSELRTYALTELIKAIKISGRICRPHAKKFSYTLYQMLYEEALTETFTYICLNINLYDPNRGDGRFMNWVNYKLDKQILKCYERYLKNSQHELLSFQDLEQLSQPANTPDLAQLLRDYIIQDPDQMFVTTHIRNRPDINFQQVSLAKFSGQSWKEISQQFNLAIPTLSSFYNRWCRRFAPLLKTELKKYF